MAKGSLNELLQLVKQQNNLQEKLERQLLKTEQLMTFSKKEMKSQLNAMAKLVPHLPLKKQKELKEIIQLICKNTEVGMMILFGSYARGDWVEEYEDDGVHFKYQSDFDLLVIVSETCKASEQKKLEHVIFKEIQKMSFLQTPVSILVHDIHFINGHLKKAQYFFSDIQKEGITLYNSGQFQLEKATELDKKQRYQLAQEDFEYCFSSAKEFFIDFQHALERKSYNKAAFELHQATEKLYTCILLTFTRYKPNTHKLDILRKLAHALDQRLIKIFSLVSQEEINHFTLLCEAYIEARYNKSYLITLEELRYLAKKVQNLAHFTEVLCQEKINSFLSH